MRDGLLETGLPSGETWSMATMNASGCAGCPGGFGASARNWRSHDMKNAVFIMAG
jgi:hypothetical protein